MSYTYYTQANGTCMDSRGGVVTVSKSLTPTKIWVKDPHVKGGGYYRLVKKNEMPSQQTQQNLVDSKANVGGWVGSIVAHQAMKAVLGPKLGMGAMLLGSLGGQVAGSVIGGKIGGLTRPKTQVQAERQNKGLNVAQAGLFAADIASMVHGHLEARKARTAQRVRNEDFRDKLLIKQPMLTSSTPGGDLAREKFMSSGWDLEDKMSGKNPPSQQEIREHLGKLTKHLEDSGFMNNLRNKLGRKIE